MRIRDAAAQSGVSAPTIRYYEQLGLLGSVKRTAAGYRIFADRDVRLLEFLRRARELGFSLDECGELIELVGARGRNTRDSVKRTRKLAMHRLTEIQRQMEELVRQSDLIQLHIESIDAPTEECPITRDL